MANILSPPPTTDGVVAHRFGRNGTDRSSAFSSNGDYQPVPRFRWAGGMARFWDRYMSLPNPIWGEAPSGRDRRRRRARHLCDNKEDRLLVQSRGLPTRAGSEAARR